MVATSYHKRLRELYIESINKLNILVLSGIGCFSPIIYKLRKEGHNVKLFIKDKKVRDIFDGIVEKTEKWEKELKWADLIVVDDNDLGEIQDDLRKDDHLVVGGSDYGVKLENERVFQMEEMKSLGFSIPFYKRFNNFKDAINFVKENKGTYVIKPDGTKMQEYKELTYVGNNKDGTDVIDMLNNMQKIWKGKIDFILQKKIDGKEVAAGAYFDGKKFIEPLEVNFEYKKLFPSSLGPNTGELGTVIKFTPFNNFFKKTLKLFEDKLRDENYIGDFDINFILTDEGKLYPLEITPRFGYPSSTIHFYSIKENAGEFLYNLARNRGKMTPVKPYCIGVVLAAPPFPYDCDVAFQRFNKYNHIEFKDNHHIAPNDVKIIDGKMKAAGKTGYLATSVGYADDLDQSIKNVYSHIKDFQYPNMFYRNDIGIGIKDRLNKLKESNLI